MHHSRPIYGWNESKSEGPRTWHQALEWLNLSEKDIEHSSSLLLPSFIPTSGLWEELLGQPWLHNGELDPLDEQTGQSVLCMWIYNPEPRIYICQVPLGDTGEYCGMRYQRQDRALTHVRAHLNYKPFACRGRCGFKDCLDAFTSEAYLKVHIQPVRKECERCGQSYLRQNIKRHAAHCK